MINLFVETFPCRVIRFWCFKNYGYNDEISVLFCLFDLILNVPSTKISVLFQTYFKFNML